MNGTPTLKAMTPLTFFENRRRSLLLFKLTGKTVPGVPSYLVDENRDILVFGQDRIVIKPAKGS